MKKDKYIILIVIYISVIADAWRDRLMHEVFAYHWNILQWQWHFAKWLAMFSLWGLLSFIWFREVKVWYKTIIIFVLFAILCSVTWDLIYPY